MRVSKCIFAVAMTIALSGCETTNTAANVVAVSPLSIDQEYGALIRNGIKRRAKDPSSVVFGPMKAAGLSDGNVAVCGYFNAKNGFGGYSGMTPFFGIITGDTHQFGLIEVGSDDTKLFGVRSMCGRYGLSV